MDDTSPDTIDDRAAAQAWARAVLADPQTVILDTETTGLDSTAEVIELAVLAPDGTVLYNSRFRPAGLIPRAATAIHGIADADVAGAPTFAECWALGLRALLVGKVVVTYNAAFDSRVLAQTLQRADLPRDFGTADWACAMERYAAWYGQWSDYHGHYRWVSLAQAARDVRVSRPDHTALGDARACLAVIQAMAEEG